MKQIFLTGACGFIGSHLTDLLLEKGYSVIGYDNLSSGQLEFVQNALKHPKFTFIKGDLLDKNLLTNSISGCDTVFHLAANADVRGGVNATSRDLEQNTLATHNVLEAMRTQGIKRISFSSTGAVYGEPSVFPTPENCSIPIQTSLYGASKMACEGLIHAYCEGFGFEGYIYRFVSLLGPRYSHGHVFDFVKKLKANPSKLLILGNGRQRKSYLHVEDCVRAVLHVVEKQTALKAKHRVETYNLGLNEILEVSHSARAVSERMGLNPEFVYSGGDRGWIGDQPFVHLDTQKILSTGWKPTYTIQDSLRVTTDWILKNDWILNRRSLGLVQ